MQCKKLHVCFTGRRGPDRSTTVLGGATWRLLYAMFCNSAACLANNRAKAFFPFLAAAVIVSKKTGERSTGPGRPAQ